MAALLAAICGTLIVLAFCQVIIETILPEGTTKRYVTFIAGLAALAVIVSIITMSGRDAMKAIYQKSADMQKIAESEQTPESAGTSLDPYKEYLEKLINANK